MVKRNCTPARTRVRPGSREGSLANKPTLAKCVRDLTEVKLRLETAQSAVACVLGTVSTHSSDISLGFANDLSHAARNVLADRVKRLNAVVQTLDRRLQDSAPSVPSQSRATH